MTLDQTDLSLIGEITFLEDNLSLLPPLSNEPQSLLLQLK